MISMHNMFPECQAKHNNTIDETKQVAQVKSVTRPHPKININILEILDFIDDSSFERKEPSSAL